MQKWVWFLQNVGVVQKFSRATRTINTLCPHNVQHLPTPLIFMTIWGRDHTSIIWYGIEMCP